MMSAGNREENRFIAQDQSASSPRYLAALGDAGICSALTDSQLLERFATNRGAASELAFAALVDRHGPMVLRACRGILRDDHEAMDAFQATFLVLVRKRGSLWVRDSLGPWLYRVACRVAGRARTEARRRRALERRTAAMVTGETGDTNRDDLAAALHAEIDRLPGRYRTPILLCCLEGRTCAEAAQLIGCPVGTVASRLSRGRDQLRANLGRRGFAIGLAALGGAFASEAAGAVVPPALSSATARMAVASIAGSTLVPTGVVTLTREALTAMLMTKLKLLTAVVVSVGVLAGGVLAIARYAQAPPRAANVNAKDELVVPATGAVRPVVVPIAVGRPPRKPDSQIATLKGQIVLFGEGKLDVADIYQIRVLDPGGKAPRIIAELPGHAWSGRISPDGRRIAFLLPPTTIQGAQGINLWIMDADGRNRERIVENAGGKIGMAVACWSPDGRQVAFHRQDKLSAIENYAVDLDTRTLSRLQLPGNEVVASWSPDGTEWLTCTLGEPPDPNPGRFQIFRVRVDGTGRVRLGEPDMGNVDARCSPDGRRIVYLAGAPRPTDERRSQVRVVDREGGPSKLILEADPGVSYQSPCWSPDGKRIAVISTTPGDTAVLIVDADGREPAHRITAPPKQQAKEMSGVGIDW
jgi:RNA polymerase sigma factor (sigma-70 family)